MKRAIFIILLLFGIVIQGHTQVTIIKNLKDDIANAKDQADKIIPMSKLALYYRSTSPDQAMDLANETLEYAIKEKDNKYLLYAYTALAGIRGYADSIKLCYNTIDTCLQYIATTSDPDAKIFALNQIAINRMMFGDRDMVLEVLNEAVELLKNHKNKELETEVYYSLYCYYSFSDVDNTGKYIRLTLKSATESKLPHLISQAWSGLGHYYQEKYKQNLNKVYLDSAVYVLNNALTVAEQNRESVRRQEMLLSLINLSSTYGLKNTVENIYSDSIIYYAQRAIDIAKGEEGALEYICYAYLALSDAQKDKAEELLSEAANIIDKYNYTELKYQLHYKLSEIYEEKGEYQKAYKHLTIALENYSKSNDERYTKEGQKLAAKYELEKKEQKIRTQNEQSNLQMIIIFALAMAIVALVMLFIYHIKYQQQRRYAAEREKEESLLRAQVKELETKRLQQEVLINNMQLNYKNELLENILKSAAIDKSKIERILSKDLKIDNNFEDFKTELKDIHPDFYTKLQERSQQKLTSLDLKYCVCIFMKMSSKEIAELLHVESKTVRMAKYRLKQKLNLSKEDDLNDFINQII